MPTIRLLKIGVLTICMLMISVMTIPAAQAIEGLRQAEANTASEAELDSVRGIGPDLNARIRAQRELRPFADWGDFIRRIKPMGAAKARQLSDAGLTVAGQPYAAP